MFTFDGAQTLRLVNRAGERLLAQPAEQLARTHGRRARTRRLPRRDSRRASMDVTFPGGVGPLGGAAHDSFRQGGLPHQLLVLADVSRPLRDEERQAWQRLIRVIGHEINNSLAPIKSIAGSLEAMLRARAAAGRLERRHATRARASSPRGRDSLEPLHDAPTRGCAKLPAPQLRRRSMCWPRRTRRAPALETRLSDPVVGRARI